MKDLVTNILAPLFAATAGWAGPVELTKTDYVDK